MCSHLLFLFGTGTDDGTVGSVFTSALSHIGMTMTTRHDDDDDGGGGGGGGGGDDDDDNKVKVADETCLVLEQTMEQ